MFDNSDELIKPLDHRQNNQVDKAKEWSKKAMRYIITPEDSLKDLDNAWDNFNSMIKKNRRESDWKSIELFDMTNQEHYEKLRDKFMALDIENKIETDLIPLIQDGDDPISESYIDLDAADSYYNADAINYTTEDVNKAKEWGKESNRTIIIPTRTLEELENLWDSFNLMIKKHRRESDWMSLELFGLSNLKHYEYLKNQFLKEDIKKDDYDYISEASRAKSASKYINELAKNSPIALTESIIKLVKPNKTIYEEIIINNIVSDAIASYTDGLSPSIIPSINCSDMPYLTPNDMIDMGVYGQSPVDNYFNSIADNSMINENISVKEWFSMYQAANDGFYTEMGSISSDWVHKVRELTYGLSRMIENGAGDMEINSRKQSILELGWNPDIEFSNDARIIARESFIDRVSRKMSKTKIVNLTEFKYHNNYSMINEAINNKQNLKPIYIIMTEGKRLVSKAIKAATHNKYSHASISFDPSLTEMYSYGMQGQGFRSENINEDIPDKTSRIGVYLFFVSDSIYDKIIAFINNLKENPSKTKYSYKNLLTYVFNIPYNNDYKMICSQFVDRCLKVAGINISRTDSSLVSPAKLDTVLKNEKKIYHIYEGLATKYDAKRAEHLTNSLLKKCKPLKEYSIKDINTETSYMNTIYSNCRDILALSELSKYKDIVSNNKYKPLLEKVLFDILEVEPFLESGESVIDDRPSIDFMGKMIRKFMNPI